MNISPDITWTEYNDYIAWSEVAFSMITFYAALFHYRLKNRHKEARERVYKHAREESIIVLPGARDALDMYVRFERRAMIIKTAFTVIAVLGMFRENQPYTPLVWSTTIIMIGLVLYLTGESRHLERRRQATERDELNRTRYRRRSSDPAKP